MAVDVQYMTLSDIAQSLRTAQLEQIYQQTLAQAERIYEDERARALRVQLLLLEDENDDLHEQMENGEDELHRLEANNDELQDQLSDIGSQYQAAQMELKAQLRDLDRYRTEVNALNAARVDSTTLLTEKLALSRELATLKPELEHLRSQAATQQSVLGQKLALERELSSLQVELETEKRTVQRLKSKDKSTSSADAALADEIEHLKNELTKERRVAKEAAYKDVACAERIEELEQDLAKALRNSTKPSSEQEALSKEVEDLKAELEKERRRNSKIKSKDEASSSIENDELKKELAKVKRDAQKVVKENLKKGVEWDSLKEALEEKLDAFRTKLRTTKEQLKEAQDELERLEQAKFAAATEASKARLNGVNPRKRNIARFDPDMTIGTPGHGGPSKKQRISVNPGDKSNFSITPFLNKTMSILPESPEDRANEEQDDETVDKHTDVASAEVDKEEHPTTGTNLQKPKVAKKAITAKPKAAKPLRETTNPKANSMVKKMSLPKVVEEEPEVAEIPQARNDENAASPLPKKKVVNKRPTIFDDDEDLAPKKTKKLNLGGLKSSGLGLGKINLGGKNKVLAEFSPLKKDRAAAVAL